MNEAQRDGFHKDFILTTVFRVCYISLKKILTHTSWLILLNVSIINKLQSSHNLHTVAFWRLVNNQVTEGKTN